MSSRRNILTTVNDFREAYIPRIALCGVGKSGERFDRGLGGGKKLDGWRFCSDVIIIVMEQDALFKLHRMGWYEGVLNRPHTNFVPYIYSIMDPKSKLHLPNIIKRDEFVGAIAVVPNEYPMKVYFELEADAVHYTMLHSTDKPLEYDHKGW